LLFKKDFYIWSIMWKPLNVITLVQKETDNINKIITVNKLSAYGKYRIDSFQRLVNLIT
jgi:hypothetical protein